MLCRMGWIGAGSSWVGSVKELDYFEDGTVDSLKVLWIGS